jgi:hypothetical protein
MRSYIGTRWLETPGVMRSIPVGVAVDAAVGCTVGAPVTGIDGSAETVTEGKLDDCAHEAQIRNEPCRADPKFEKAWRRTPMYTKLAALICSDSDP